MSSRPEGGISLISVHERQINCFESRRDDISVQKKCIHRFKSSRDDIFFGTTDTHSFQPAQKFRFILNLLQCRVRFLTAFGKTSTTGVDWRCSNMLIHFSILCSATLTSLQCHPDRREGSLYSCSASMIQQRIYCAVQKFSVVVIILFEICFAYEVQFFQKLDGCSIVRIHIRFDAMKIAD